MKIEWTPPRKAKEGRWLTASRRSMRPEERHARKSGNSGDNPFYYAELFHANSKYHPDLMSTVVPMTEYLKPYQFHSDVLPFVQVPKLDELPALSTPLGEALMNRRSSWDFAEPITDGELFQVLRYGLGVSDTKQVSDGKVEFELRMRTYPSGGALYPTMIYVYVHQVTGLDQGMYRYEPYTNRLYLLEAGSFIDEMATLFTSTDPGSNPWYRGQDFSQAGAFVFLAGDFRHQSDKYGIRAYRLALLEAGHAAQNVALVSTALGLTSVTLAGFYDDRANNLLHLDGVNQALIYLLPIGRKGEI